MIPKINHRDIYSSLKFIPKVYLLIIRLAAPTKGKKIQQACALLIPLLILVYENKEEFRIPSHIMTETIEHVHHHNATKNNIVLTSGIYFRVVYFVFVVILYILSILGGVFVCYVIRKHNLVRKKTWMYLLILTISDTGACFFEIPILCVATVDETVLDIPELCTFNASITLFFSGLTIFTLVAISVHRCRTVTNPLQSHVTGGYRDIKISLAISVLVSGFFALAPIFGFSRYTHIEGRKWCAIVDRKGHMTKLDIMYMASITVFGYIIPNAIMLATSLRICCVVRKQQEHCMRIRRATQADIREDQRTMTKTMSLIIGSYFILFTPTFAYILIGMAHVDVPLILSHIVYVNLLLQGVVNTTIYCFRHQVFKDELAQWFCRKSQLQYRERNQSQLFVIQMENVSQTGNSESQSENNNTYNITPII